MNLLSSVVSGIRDSLYENNLNMSNSTKKVEWYFRTIQVMDVEVRLEETFEYLPECIESASKDLCKNLELLSLLEEQLGQLEERMLDRTPIALGNQIKLIRQKVQEVLEIPRKDADFINHAKLNLKHQLIGVYKNLIFIQLSYFVPCQILHDWFINNNTINLNHANDKLLEALSLAIPTNQLDVVERALNNLKGPFEEFYNRILEGINGLENFCEGHENEKLVESLKVIQKDLDKIQKYPQLIGEIVEYEHTIFKQDQQQFLVDGICLGAVISYALDQLKDSNELESSIQINERSRFIQGIHKINFKTISGNLNEFLIKNLGREVGLKFLELLNKIPAKYAHLSNQDLNEISDASILTPEEFELLKEYVKKLDIKGFTTAIDIYFDYLLPVNFLNKVGLTTQSIIGIGQEAERLQKMDLGEFIAHFIDDLITASNVNSHYLLCVNQLATEKYRQAGVLQNKRTGKFNTTEAAERSLLKARSILGEDPPEKILDRATTYLFMKELFEQSNEPSEPLVIMRSI